MLNKNTIIERTAQEPEDRLLLARVWDKYEQTQRKNIPGSTVFLSPREQRMAQAMLSAAGVRPGYAFDGGFEAAERKILIFFPDWMTEAAGDELTFLRAAFHGEESLSHRDLLGSLMGLGITRERVGDILGSPHSADIVASPSLRDFFLREWSQAGRVKLSVAEIERGALCVPQAQVKVIRDTVPSLRLDAVAAAAFSMSRGRAAELIAVGRVSLDHVPCLKGDKPVEEGAVITARGLGKAKLAQVGGRSRKGRIGVTVERFI